MTILTNKVELINALEKAELDYLKEFQNVVDMIIREYIEDYYHEYTPKMYKRRYQLLKKLVKSDIEKTANGYVGYVYFDVDDMYYKAHSGLEVVEMVNRGYHADTRLNYNTDNKENRLSSYNTPYDIKSPTDKSYFSTTGSTFFWETSMFQAQEELYDTLTKCFKKHGITVRKV